MIKLLSTLFILLCLTQVAIAKEVHDTNLKLKCSTDKKRLAGRESKDASVEEISIEIKKIDWNKDVSKPPNVGSMSNIKIQTASNLREASLLLSTKQRVAFSYVDGSEKEGSPTFAQIYELDIETMEIKKTTVSLFNQSNNKIISSVSYCKKQ
jgi:hypothetical protein